MKRSTLAGSATAFFCLGFATTLLAAEPAANGTVSQSPPTEMKVAAADFLGQLGQQQTCEDALATTRDIYKDYVADMRNGKVPMAVAQGWQEQQIAAAQPVTPTNNLFRADKLVGAEVRSPQNEALGSVDNLVMSAETGMITYVVIARSGSFGTDEKYVPVPWEDFKIAPNGKLLVLDTTKDVLNTAPQVGKDQFEPLGHFGQKTREVDGYWKTHLSDNGKG